MTIITYSCQCFPESAQVLIKSKLHVYKSFPSLMLKTGLNHIETDERNDWTLLRLKTRVKPYGSGS